MDPKDNDTQIPGTGDQTQPTDQQKADGELVVSHEAELDTDSTNAGVPADGTLPSTDPNAVAGDVTNLDVTDPTSIGMSNSDQTVPSDVPADQFDAPAAPVSPLGDQPAPPLQPFNGDLTADAAGGQPQAPAQPDAAQPFPPAGPAAPTDPGVVAPGAPVASADPSAPVAPLADANAPMGGGAAEGKNKAMMLLLIAIAAVVILGLGVYALTAL